MADTVKYPIPSFKMFEIEQQIKYGFTEEVCYALSEWKSLEFFLWKVHDQEEGVEPHIHFYGKAKGKNSIPTGAILAKVNKIAGKDVIKFQQLEKIKGSWKDICAYATHKNCPDKYQYSNEDVHANFDFRALAEEAVNKNYIKDPILRKYINLINTGVLTRYNYIDFMPIDHYVTYNVKLEKAFKYKNDELRRNNINRQDFKVIYIHGGSETGKSTLAKYICKSMEYEYAISSSSNDILQDYDGQPALILDELRPGNIRFTDFLKLLDHNTATSGSARYKNPFMDLKLIIITTVLDITDFYKKIHEDNDEPVKQLHRRIDICLKCLPGVIRVSQYNDKDDYYETICDFSNEISKKYSNKALSHEEKEETKSIVSSALSLFSSSQVPALDYRQTKVEDLLTDQEIEENPFLWNENKK